LPGNSVVKEIIEGKLDLNYYIKKNNSYDNYDKKN
jgi:hypothetical protein